MSVLWGFWQFDRNQKANHVLQALPNSLKQWGPDGFTSWNDYPGLTLGIGAYHVTHEDFRQGQPFKSSLSGCVVTFDGRLDNRFELMNELGLFTSSQPEVRQGTWNPAFISSPPFPVLSLRPKLSLTDRMQPADWHIPSTNIPTDLEIVSAAFDRWNRDCFDRLHGDWAIAVWDSSSETMWLARDPAGSRHLSYTATDRSFCWSTRYECLGRMIKDGALNGVSPDADMSYGAASAICIPAVDSTPYRAIRSVPPGSVLGVRRNQPPAIVRTSLPPVPALRRSIGLTEASDLFRLSLEQSLLRRMRSAFPVSFELSGGCDSSTLVCLASELRERLGLTQEFHTLTRYSPMRDTNDRYYAGIIEEHIGQTGKHFLNRPPSDAEEKVIPAKEETESFDETSHAALEHSRSIAMRETWLHRSRYSDAMAEWGSRVLMSGIGGDELTGGVQDAALSLISEWRCSSPAEFLASIQQWAKYKKETVWRLLWQMALQWLPLRLSSWFDGPARRQSSVIASHFPEIGKVRLRMMRTAFMGSVRPWKSQYRQDERLWPLSSTLSHKQRLPHAGCWHRAFPFTDRDFVVLHSELPSFWLQTAFHRRRLLRNAFSNTVPGAVLWRRTKDMGKPATKSIDGSSKRTVKDLEENAVIFEILRKTSYLANDMTPAVAPADCREERAETSARNVPPVRNRFEGQRFAVHESLRSASSVQDGATLLDVQNGNRVVLNGTAAIIWTDLTAGDSVKTIAENLSRRFDIPLDVALADTVELIEDLLRRNIIQPVKTELVER